MYLIGYFISQWIDGGWGKSLNLWSYLLICMLLIGVD